MAAQHTITLLFPNNRRETVNAGTLTALARIESRMDYKAGESPLMILFPDGRKMIYNKPGLKWLVLLEKTEEEAWEAWGCDGLYRNTTTLRAMNDEVEPHCLWMLRGSMLYLVDDDRDITADLNETLFTEVC